MNKSKSQLRYKFHNLINTFLLEEVVTSTISYNKFQLQLLLRSNFSQELNDVTLPLLIVEKCGLVSSCLHLSSPTCFE